MIGFRRFGLEFVFWVFIFWITPLAGQQSAPDAEERRIRGADEYEARPAVVDRPGLSEADIEFFVRVNAVAEPRRMEFLRDVIENGPPPRRQTSPGKPRSPESAFYASMAEDVMAMHREARRIEDETCGELGVDPAQYQELIVRFAQVSDLREIEFRQMILQTEREEAARLESADPEEITAMARSQAEAFYHAQHGMAEQAVERARQSVLRAETAAKQRREAASRKAAERSAKAGRNSESDAKRIDQMRMLIEERRRMLDDPRMAQSRSNIERDIEKIEEVLAKLEARGARRDQSGDAADTARAAQREDRERAVIEREAASLAEAESRLAELEARWESGAMIEENLAAIPAGIAARRARIKERESGIAAALARPAMRQADLDRPVALRHTEKLVIMGDRLIREIPTEFPPMPSDSGKFGALDNPGAGDAGGKPLRSGSAAPVFTETRQPAPME